MSSLFVLLMMYSKDIAKGNQDRGISILYAMMSIAYLAAETWLGALNGFVALLLPPAYKTFGLAIWATIQVLIYSAGPQIIGLALRNTDVVSPAYTKDTQVALAVIIHVGYWVAGAGFLVDIPLLRKELVASDLTGEIRRGRKVGMLVSAALVVAMVMALFVASIVYAVK